MLCVIYGSPVCWYAVTTTMVFMYSIGRKKRIESDPVDDHGHFRYAIVQPVSGGGVWRRRGFRHRYDILDGGQKTRLLEKKCPCFGHQSDDRRTRRVLPSSRHPHIGFG